MTSFPDAIKLFFSNYANFSGRSSRSEYWWMYLLIFGFATILSSVFFFAALIPLISSTEKTTIADVGIVGNLIIGIWVVFVLTILVPWLSLTTRRLHDMDQSGWWVVLSIIFPPINLIVLVFALMPSTPGTNKYGEPSGVFEITSSTPIAAYRPVMPAPVFETNIEAPLDNGRFSVNRQQQTELAPPPSAPQFYKRSGIETDLPIPSVGLPEIPKLFKPVSTQPEEIEALDEHTEVEEVEEMPQFSYSSKPEEPIRPPVEDDLPAIELLDLSNYLEEAEEKPSTSTLPQKSDVPSLPKLPDFKATDEKPNISKTPPLPPKFGNK